MSVVFCRLTTRYLQRDHSLRTANRLHASGRQSLKLKIVSQTITPPKLQLSHAYVCYRRAYREHREESYKKISISLARELLCVGRGEKE